MNILYMNLLKCFQNFKITYAIYNYVHPNIPHSLNLSLIICFSIAFH